jgi:hypothetical protein
VAEQKKPDAELVDVTIVRGSIHTGHGESALVHGPGATVAVPKDEVPTLIMRGIIADPNAAPIAVGAGPTFRPDGGPTITPGA